MFLLKWTALLLIASNTAASVSFDVTVAKDALTAPRDGRVVVYVVGPDRAFTRHARPAEWDYCHDPMPVYATDVKSFGEAAHVTLDQTSDHFKTALDALAPGRYAAQAVFDWHHDASGWNMEPGNLSSGVVKFEVKAGAPTRVPIELSRVVNELKFDRPDVALVEVKSKLLSDFNHRDVILRAGVALPINFSPDEKYAAIYEVPGFGGRHDGALEAAGARASILFRASPTKLALARQTFHIFIDPESSNGHTLMADSDVNGPCGRALVEELIPAIEKRFPQLIAGPRARLLTGHSSGGWSVCYLQTHFDDFFGGAWPSSPDPVDFHRFELIDLYAADNLYVKDGHDVPADRDASGTVTLSARDENAWEQTVAPDNAGGLQWQSWQAVFGVRRGDGHPTPLYDIHTGVIDRTQLDHYRRYDLDAQLAADPKKYAPIWREKIRLIVGDSDDYYLHEAVKRLGDTLAALPPTGTPETNRGYVKIVPGKTHETIYATPEMEAFDREMLEALEEHR